MSQFQLHENPAEVNPDQVIDLYHLIGGGRPGLEPEKIRLAFSNSTYVAIATLPSGELIGWIRALSDQVSTTWIPEMVVHPEFQTLGVDGLLLDATIAQFKSSMIYFQASYTEFSERIKFFEDRGIKPMPNMIVCGRIGH
ncbi:hypothetical protein COW36_14540 [bacterium (Candidatus Blackallbacteria) CG17_big_fil_post_rev_8_21_14_2_50_48_46]|uniref:Uncharacterized protein n=1 Tax=bacterium (Candidatus Blackallbacteria) CG17_big_fil_post_rev_8_21_14_2_50_48_46 TaxID=2014261 RepID=A0A2M7G2B0_9BACT|nr:MAG: hypothetical protein COW64_12010 [bacterium (Candidatus Blackallbacteria) CG18_big_fil_WC_8_21_14_2_50_49_26]PIW15934.1 MAG: hypothetical protein COW36_14540 [bacterium (Candidatus Blackallbacteria) CG17_big_fil_post_rev_8_21_14_2_50_48_46]PIW50346.1 MAG: hypothetical protein COW20_02255 [bacterium (Candidatus Blackallbacteria) CG13_big_fil_rev_8_21_14_2_50_49_14]